MNPVKQLVGIVLLILIPLALYADASDADGTWGDGTRYYQYERFFITGQPDTKALEQGGEDGASVVINLRGESESDWDEQSVVESMGLEYHQVPVDGTNLAPEAMQQITAIVEANPDSAILVHCASGNRAAAWLAIYLSESRGMNADEALEVAKSNGLTNAGLEERVRAYLAE